MARVNRNKMTKIEKKSHIEQIVSLLNQGEVVLVGEYRGTRVDEREFKDRLNPAVKVTRVSVTHSFESATGEQMPCTEYLPEGTKLADVKVTHQVGEKHACVLNSLKYDGGIRKITVKRFELLSGLGV